MPKYREPRPSITDTIAKGITTAPFPKPYDMALNVQVELEHAGYKIIRAPAKKKVKTVRGGPEAQ